jgi:hypothetical protein
MKFRQTADGRVILGGFVVPALCLIFFFFSGCTHYAVRTADNPKCRTVVSGFFGCPQRWAGKYPALMVKENYQLKTYFGTIVSMDSSGVQFERTKEGILFTTPKFYDRSKIVCLIDEKDQLRFGNLPKGYGGTWDIDLELKSFNDSTSKPVTLPLEANKPFSFCLDPDIYKIINITFKRSADYIDLSRELPLLKIKVEAGKRNEAGGIFLDSLMAGKTSVDIKCKIGRRPNDAMVGMMFGAVGSIVNELSRRNDELMHMLSFSNSPSADSAAESIIIH